jgi:CubicO group peptidase (beta-lactamase class C family)
MPAGGLFSTAEDVARFCRMILNGGVMDGKRYISTQSLHLMTSEQNGGMGGASYGFGWSISKSGYEHGGAFNNVMEIDPVKGRILIFMVQQDGAWGHADGENMKQTLERFADGMVTAGDAHSASGSDK